MTLKSKRGNKSHFEYIEVGAFHIENGKVHMALMGAVDAIQVDIREFSFLQINEEVVHDSTNIK